MDLIVEQLFSDIATIIANLGRDGGLVGASIYDTAQVLRWRPLSLDPTPTLEWLLAQQHADGSWGDQTAPQVSSPARDLSMLAAVLALLAYRTQRGSGAAIDAGAAFLSGLGARWSACAPDLLPVGGDLLLPRMLADAAAQGVAIETDAAGLAALGAARRARLDLRRAWTGSLLAHLWEGWGEDAGPWITDGSGSIGHSPAATAFWLHQFDAQSAGLHTRSPMPYRAAEHYMSQAAKATRISIPGVVPTVWPIARAEQVYGLYALAQAGLINHHRLRAVIQPVVLGLAQRIQPAGIGLSDAFQPDGATTAAATAVLRAAHYPISFAPLGRFRVGDRFIAWVEEPRMAFSIMASAIHAFGLGGQPLNDLAQAMVGLRQDDHWPADLWNNSWLSVTSWMLIALAMTAAVGHLAPMAARLVRSQRADGGWGEQLSTAEETAAVLLALRVMRRHGLIGAEGHAALRQGRAWLREQYLQGLVPVPPWRLAKEPFSAPRVSQLMQMSALLACYLDDEAMAGQ